MTTDDLLHYSDDHYVQLLIKKNYSLNHFVHMLINQIKLNKALSVNQGGEVRPLALEQ